MVRLIWRLLVMRTVLLVRRWLQLGAVFIAGTAGTAMAAGTIGTADAAVAAGALVPRWLHAGAVGGCWYAGGCRCGRYGWYAGGCRCGLYCLYGGGCLCSRWLLQWLLQVQSVQLVWRCSRYSGQ